MTNAARRNCSRARASASCAIGALLGRKTSVPTVSSQKRVHSAHRRLSWWRDRIGIPESTEPLTAAAMLVRKCGSAGRSAYFETSSRRRGAARRAARARRRPQSRMPRAEEAAAEGAAALRATGRHAAVGALRCVTRAALPQHWPHSNLAEPRLFGGLCDNNDKRRIERRKRARGWSSHPCLVPAGAGGWRCPASSLAPFVSKSPRKARHTTTYFLLAMAVIAPRRRNSKTDYGF